ncbi:MAG: ABC transporter permease [Acidobacteriia bacterium]|nr:ABC transporter permease [Terriglobia bacterium]
MRDLKFGLRALLKDAGFSTTVVLTLALCIGANTAIFAIVHSVLLRPLPVPRAEEILLMSNQYPKAGATGSTNSGAADYYDRLKEVTVFQQQAMFNFGDQTVDMNGTPERITGMIATPSLFRLLESAPLLGRTFNDDEGEIGAERKVLLSYGLWRQMYAGAQDVLGKQIRLNGRPYTIVGVMPADFKFVNPEVRLWVPLAFTAEQKAARHSNNWYNVGRLKSGATLQQAQMQVDALNRANLERFPQWKEILTNAGFHTTVDPLRDVLVKDVKSTLYLLWGGALFVLLIGAVNIANLALARVTLRRKEFATRLALGAGRVQIVRQALVENVLICGAGGLVGIALGTVLLRSLMAIGLKQLPRVDEVRIDVPVILVVLAMSIFAGILVALIPLAHIFRTNLNDALHEDSRTGTGGTGSRRVRQSLVVAQIGFAFVLLVGAGLLLVSFRQLLNVDPGFTTGGVMTASVSAPRSRYPGDPELRTLLNRSMEAIRRIPGVTAAGVTSSIPFGFNHSDSVIFAEGYVMKPGESLISPREVTVSPGYFEAMGISMVRGRAFDDRDSEHAPLAVIVDEKLARHFWPHRDPVGQRMYMPDDINNLMKTDEHTRWLNVVGVVREVRLDDLAGNGTPVGVYYFPFAQSTEHGFTFAVKSASDLGTAGRAVRAAISGVDPELALFDAHTMAERAELSMSTRKTPMALALGFGGLALFLSAIGIYGVLTYLVTQRRREIGIRTALGCSASGIVRLVVSEGLTLVGIGLILGVAGAAALRKALENELYGVQPLDPLVMASVTVVLTLVAIAACLLPARRATQVDPVIVLNEQ